ncbi:hypothetical protein AB0L66_39685, partial [Streptomyces sp. NPDC052207]|uniref:hypothetical protein n=1 Tax=Streptomyces sp. NPDC052207 TaxID=3155418 RepID=UPI0034468DE2
AYIWFFVAAAVFWMIYDQGGSTLSIFADSSPHLRTCPDAETAPPRRSALRTGAVRGAPAP